MTRGVFMLKAMTAKHALRKFSQVNATSYKYVHSVLRGIKPPSYDIMKKFRSVIPVEYWFIESDDDFVQTIVDLLKNDRDEDQDEIDYSYLLDVTKPQKPEDYD